MRKSAPPACPVPIASASFAALLLLVSYLPPHLPLPLQIMVLSTFLPLVAGRFGLAPTSTRHTNSSGIKLLPEEKTAGLVSNDPAGAWGCRGWARCCSALAAAAPSLCWLVVPVVLWHAVPACGPAAAGSAAHLQQDWITLQRYYS